MHRLGGPGIGQRGLLRNDKCIEDFSSISVGVGKVVPLRRYTFQRREITCLTEFIHSWESAQGRCTSGLNVCRLLI